MTSADVASALLPSSVGLVEVLQIVVVPVLLSVLRNVNATRLELVRVRERLAAVETAVEIGLDVKIPNRGRE